MKLMLAWRFPQDAAVEVESDGIFYLGEICYCRPELGGFIMGIEVQRVHTGLRDLAQLRRSIAEGSPCEPLSEYADTASGDDEHRQLRNRDRSRI